MTQKEKGLGSVPTQPNLILNLRSQVLQQNAQGHNIWRVSTTQETVAPHRTALLLCDVWDNHWSQGAVTRLEAMLPRMAELVRVARDRGVQILHAPSETMAFYADTPARKRVQAAPPVPLPPSRERPDPPLPIDASDGGSDTGETSWYRAWSRQHPAIPIDQDRDGISDSGQEIYNFLKQRQIQMLLLMGVHTNMCVLNRSFAIKQMVNWGVPIVLIRDLTDTMYNPAMPPYVAHEEGTRLVVAYIEKHWCPTIDSADLTA